MSLRHPIIAVAGSSGAGTSPITQTFQQISRREGVTAVFIEGGSFHRYGGAAALGPASSMRGCTAA